MKTDPKKLRDYGLSSVDTRKYVVGFPRVVREFSDPLVFTSCPNCGCQKLFLISVDVRDYPQLRGGSGYGEYIGCAACPFASPMVVIATKKERE